jgi:hypothetical protein
LKKILTIMLLVFLCIGTFSTLNINVNALGETHLINTVPLIGQEVTGSDWAACSQMVLRHYGTYGPQPDQIQIAREIGNESYYNNGMPADKGTFFPSWQGALSRLGKLNVTTLVAPLTFDNVVSQISNSQPIIAFEGVSDSHAVVIVGYIDNTGTTNDQVIINDPLPVGSNGTQQTLLWSTLLSYTGAAPYPFTTIAQTPKQQISIQPMEVSGILNVSIANSQIYSIQVKKWNTTSSNWSPLANIPDLTGLTGNQNLILNVTANGQGNYRLSLNASATSSWTLGFKHSNAFANAIVADPNTLVDTTMQGYAEAFGVFNSPLGFLSATNGNNFTLLSTGLASDAPGTPDDFASTDFDPVGPPGDTTSLNLTLLVPQGANSLSFDFRFLSEEFPEWVNSAYNDFFFCYFTNSTGTYQIAFDDNGHIINVNNNFFINASGIPVGTKYDGATKRLTSTVNVTAGETVSLCFMIGDVGDGIYDSAVFLDNVRFNAGYTPPGTTPTADVTVTKTAPNTIEQGQQMTYTISYFNIEEYAAKNVTIKDKLPSQVSLVSVGNGGQYFANNNTVMWNISNIAPFSSGTLTVKVLVPTSVTAGTVLQNFVNITTVTQESNLNNNNCTKFTTVTGTTQLPPNTGLNSTVGNNNGVPVVNWAIPIQFFYLGNSSITGVDIRIHINDGGADITGPMTQVPSTFNWTYTVVFYPRHGTANVTYTVHIGGANVTISYPVLIDPSGYVYNALNGKRIQGANVTLQRFDVGLQQYVTVPASDVGIEPHINPQTTDQNGGYGWNVSAGIYKVKVNATGYADNETIVTVPPAATDVNIALTPLDSTAPTTNNNYDNLWHNADFTITLTGSDVNGIDTTYYKINSGATKTVATDGQPLISVESATNTLEYWSVDNYGNIQSPHVTLSNIKLDKTAPTGSISINSGAATTTSTSVTLTLTSADALSGVSQVRFSNDAAFTSATWESAAATKAWTLTSGDGSKTVYYQVKDTAGLTSTTYSATITLSTPTSTPTPTTTTPSPSTPTPHVNPTPTPTPIVTPTPNTATPTPISPTPTPAPTDNTTTIIIVGVVGAIIAAIVVGLAIVKLRK